MLRVIENHPVGNRHFPRVLVALLRVYRQFIQIWLFKDAAKPGMKKFRIFGTSLTYRWTIPRCELFTTDYTDGTDKFNSIHIHVIRG